MHSFEPTCFKPAFQCGAILFITGLTRCAFLPSAERYHAAAGRISRYRRRPRTFCQLLLYAEDYNTLVFCGIGWNSVFGGTYYRPYSNRLERQGGRLVALLPLSLWVYHGDAMQVGQRNPFGTVAFTGIDFAFQLAD